MEHTLRTYTVMLLINLSYCYTIPPADVIVYPKGFSISVPDEDGIEIFFFYGSVNKVACNLQRNSIIMSASKCNGEKWVLENSESILKIGDIIYYWLYVKKDGTGYTQTNNFYNVSDITPYTLPDSTVPGLGSVNLPTLGVIEKSPHPTRPHSRPFLNLDPYHVTKTPFFQKEPSYSKGSRTESPSWYGKTQPSYFMHEDAANDSGTTNSVKNIDSSLEGETNIVPLPLPLNSNRDKPTSSKFNPAFQHRKHYEKSTLRSTAITQSTQDTWYWNYK